VRLKAYLTVIGESGRTLEANGYEVRSKGSKGSDSNERIILQSERKFSKLRELSEVK
jgi:hypothetical protein